MPRYVRLETGGVVSSSDAPFDEAVFGKVGLAVEYECFEYSYTDETGYETTREDLLYRQHC